MLRVDCRMLAATAAVTLAMGCAVGADRVRPPVQLAAQTSPTPAVAQPAPEPRMTLADAVARSQALAPRWSQRSAADEPGSAIPFFQANDLDEREVRALLETVTGACLEQRSSDAEPCKRFGVSSDAEDPLVVMLLEMAGEIADASPGTGATLRLLVQLEARGAWHATMAITRVLERRMAEGLQACAPPSDRELEVARAEVGDVELRTPGGAPRPPTEAELADLVYFRAALRFSGKEAGTTKEDHQAPALPDGSSEEARRETLRTAMTNARIDGDVRRHAAAAEAYLTTLGWPAPLRVAEDGNASWGGLGYFYTLSDWARSAEILGRFELAEALGRRARAFPSGSADQIQGVIRAAELRDGCRTVVAERLAAIGRDPHHSYGPERLARSGFDVTRLYRAALLDTGGEVHWAARVRAIRGYADSAGSDALPRLVELAERGPTAQRIEALETLGRLLQSQGIDPCRPSRTRLHVHFLPSGRRVRSIMMSCETRLDAKAMTAMGVKIASLAGDPDPGIRAAVAGALGSMASSHARPALEQLARDGFASGTTCTPTDDGKETCGPTLPVRSAAKEALQALAEAEGRRRGQAEELRRSR